VRISYGKESGAFTIYLREGEPDHAEDFSREADVYVDVDAEGRGICGWHWRNPMGTWRSPSGSVKRLKEPEVEGAVQLP
jgi:uncharacterized protein YuzE